MLIKTMVQVRTNVCPEKGHFPSRELFQNVRKFQWNVCEKAQPTRNPHCMRLCIRPRSRGCHDFKALSENKQLHAVACNVSCVSAFSSYPLLTLLEVQSGMGGTATRKNPSPVLRICSNFIYRFNEEEIMLYSFASLFEPEHVFLHFFLNTTCNRESCREVV